MFKEVEYKSVIRMERVTFASISSGIDIETILLVDSIREFGGSLADSRILLFLVQPESNLPSSRLDYFKKNKVELIPVSLDPEIAKFSFTISVHSASEAEKMVENKSEILVWLAPNGFIIKEPKDFLLTQSKNFGYKPVHHILIGSKFDEPLDEFWKLIYDKCEVNKETVFPMKTHVDGNTLRPYINSGFLIVRPEKGFLRKYWENYKKLFSRQINFLSS